MSKYICGATVDIGVERESQEDFVQYREFGDKRLNVPMKCMKSIVKHFRK